MKVKTSITLSEDLLKAVDKRAKQQKKTRSDFIEACCPGLHSAVDSRGAERRDLEIINRHAEALNREAAEVLEYQVLP